MTLTIDKNYELCLNTEIFQIWRPINCSYKNYGCHIVCSLNTNTRFKSEDISTVLIENWLEQRRQPLFQHAALNTITFKLCLGNAKSFLAASLQGQTHAMKLYSCSAESNFASRSTESNIASRMQNRFLLHHFRVKLMSWNCILAVPLQGQIHAKKLYSYTLPLILSH